MKAAEIVGAALIVGTLVAGAGDAVIASQQWATWGPLAPSQPVPTFATKGFATPGFDASDLTDADLEGDVSMLMFWASWCGASESQMRTAPSAQPAASCFPSADKASETAPAILNSRTTLASAMLQKRTTPSSPAVDR